MRSLTMLLAALFPSAASFADEGELAVAASVGAELAWLTHPRLSEPRVEFESNAPTALMSRVRAEARYCPTNDFEIGVGLDVGGTANVTTTGVLDATFPGDVVTGGYFALGVPLIVAWRYDTGDAFSGVAAFDVAPAVALWSGNALVDPSKNDEQGRPLRLPVDVPDLLQAGVDVAVRVLVEWRLGDMFALRAGPYLGGGWKGAPDVRVGAVIEGALITVPPWQ